jgi:hypothetical protein
LRPIEILACISPTRPMKKCRLVKHSTDTSLRTFYCQFHNKIVLISIISGFTGLRTWPTSYRIRGEIWLTLYS